MPSRDFHPNEDLFSSRMIPMHSFDALVEDNTVGPAMSLRNVVCLLPARTCNGVCSWFRPFTLPSQNP